MANWRVGCSGFHYKHWRGIFYPEKLAMSKWFDYYNNHFKTLELNVTFYRFPRLSFLEPWYNESPPGFTFSVKAPRAITHYKKFVDSKRYLDDFYGTIQEGLKEKVGCVLFQMPATMSYKQEKLELIAASLNPSFKNVLEFRNATWWNQRTYDTLSSNNITFCGMSHPDLPDEVVQNNKVVYYRLHGTPHLYRSKYPAEILKKIAEEIKNNVEIKDAFIYFNNDIDGAAITNALEMEKYLG